MPLENDDITATNSLTVTEGSGGPTFAQFLPSGVLSKAYVSAKFGIGTRNPLNMLDVAGAAAIGDSYTSPPMGTLAAPANGLIVEGDVGIGSGDKIPPNSITGSHIFDGSLPLSKLSCTAQTGSGTIAGSATERLRWMPRRPAISSSFCVAYVQLPVAPR